MATHDVVPTGGLRASDADRERVAAIIRDAAGTGRFTLDEADQRLAAVYAARYLADLGPLTADLPDSGRPTAADPRPHPLARTAVSRHLTGYLAIAALLVGIWAATGAGAFWPVWPILGIGVTMFARPRGLGWCGRRTRAESPVRAGSRVRPGSSSWAGSSAWEARGGSAARAASRPRRYRGHRSCARRAVGVPS